jgi:hypothetical protein
MDRMEQSKILWNNLVAFGSEAGTRGVSYHCLAVCRSSMMGERFSVQGMLALSLPPTAAGRPPPCLGLRWPFLKSRQRPVQQVCHQACAEPRQSALVET